MPASNQPYETVEDFFYNILYRERSALVKNTNAKKATYKLASDTRYGKEVKLIFMLTQQIMAVQHYLQRLNERTGLLAAEAGESSTDEPELLSEQNFYLMIREVLKRVNANSKPNLIQGSAHFMNLLSDEIFTTEVLREDITIQTSIELLYKMIRQTCTKLTRKWNWPFLLSLTVEDFTARFRIQMLISTIIKLLINDFPFAFLLPVSPGNKEKAVSLAAFAFLPLAISIVIVGTKAYQAGQLHWHKWWSPFPAAAESRAVQRRSLLTGIHLPEKVHQIFQQNTQSANHEFIELQQEFRQKKIEGSIDLGFFGITLVFVFTWYFFADGYAGEGTELNDYNQYTIFPLLLMPVFSELLKMVLRRCILY